MKPVLQLRISQHLALTPQLQQAIRLLQLSTLELQAEIDQAVQDNPLLEQEDVAVDDFTRETLRTQRAERIRSGDSDIDDWVAQQPAPEPTLVDHLLQQLSVTRATRRTAALVELLIAELDDNGYLPVSLDEVAATLPAQLAIEFTELKAAFNLLRSFDPAGVGAHDLSDCLLLQLREPDVGVFPELADAQMLADVRTVCEHHLPLLASRDYARLRRLLRCTDEHLRVVQSIVRRLNPRPGAKYATTAAAYVTPDVIVRKSEGRWKAVLNEAVLPRLNINRMYADIIKNERAESLSEQLREARWLIRNVQQRYTTILKVAQEIVARQEGFFEHGPIAMRPLVLSDVANAIGMHESTVSRVTNQKYMLTPYGTMEFKRFFGSQVSTQAGGAASATAVQTLIRQLLAAENTRKPLSDNKIAQLLAEQGLIVARRTVAKYREAMQIPPASQRKSL